MICPCACHLHPTDQLYRCRLCGHTSYGEPMTTTYDIPDEMQGVDPRRLFFHQIQFTAQGTTEADVDDEIERKLVRLTENPSDWTVVTKNMTLQSIDQMDGTNAITVLHAECLAIKPAGVVPWPIYTQPHQH